MERDAAMAALPDVYRAALELREEGMDVDEMAVRLDVDSTAIPALLTIGEEKLARLLVSPITTEEL